MSPAIYLADLPRDKLRNVPTTRSGTSSRSKLVLRTPRIVGEGSRTPVQRYSVLRNYVRSHYPWRGPTRSFCYVARGRLPGREASSRLLVCGAWVLLELLYAPQTSLRPREARTAGSQRCRWLLLVLLSEIYECQSSLGTLLVLRSPVETGTPT